MSAIENITAPKIARQTPLRIYKQEQARISRSSLYKTTAFYTTYAMIVLYFLLRSAHPLVGLFFYSIGLATYTLVEYVFHRWVLHMHFADGPGIHKYLHKYLDPLHFGHHENPYDGHHINGDIENVLPLFFVCAPLSHYLSPIYFLPAILAGTVQSYIITEWIHHSMHLYNFKNVYFRYARRHHFYHHSPRGITRGYGVTSGFWDVPFKTRYPAEVRWALHQRPKELLKRKQG